VQLLTLDGYDQPFVYPEGEKFEGWRIQFIYDQKTQSKMAFLRPTNGHSQAWVLNEQQQPVWFVTYAPDGSRHQMSVVRIHNPKDPAQPAADETMFLLVSWGEWMAQRPFNYRAYFKHMYLENPDDSYFATIAPRIVIATENGYFEKNSWGNLPTRPSLDSLLGMEGNDVTKIKWKSGDFDFSVNIPYWLGNVNDKNKIAEITFDTDLIPLELQGMVFVISP
jgi:hypothetical protein